jgi:hypothetical protein
VRSVDAEAPKARSMGGREDRLRAALERAILLALALTAPVLCLGQQAGMPIASSPAGGLPAAELPGAGLPGFAALRGLPGSPLPAEYISYGVAAGVGASDNVNLSSTDRKSGGLTAANLFFDLIRTGSRLELNALGNFSDIDYLEHSYGNQVLGRFDGLANLTLWSHHLRWLVRDDYGDTQISILQALTPTNLQRVNVFSTGPDLTLQPTLTSFIELQGIYSRDTYQTSPFDGQSEMGSFTVGHRFSPASSVSLVGLVEQERFDNRNLNTDYQIREYYGRYHLKGERTNIDLQGGVDQTNDTGSWKSSPLARLSISRNISARSIISLSGGRDYTNARNSFANLAAGASGGGIPIGAAAQTSGNALRTYGNARWDFHYLRTTIGLFGGWERNGYDRASQYDVSQTDVGLNLGRQLTPVLSAQIMATADRSRYGNQSLTNTYGTADGSLIYRPGAWVVIYGRYQHEFRRSSGISQGLGYDENRVFIMIGYYPHHRGSGAPGVGGMIGGGGPMP